jgi:hypothetical protein
MNQEFEIDGYRLSFEEVPPRGYLYFVGDFADQLQVFLAEVTRQGEEGMANRENIRQGIGRPGPGIAYERYELGERWLVSEGFTQFQTWWNTQNGTPLKGPIWTVMLEWKPNVEAFIPHETLMKILDLQQRLADAGIVEVG